MSDLTIPARLVAAGPGLPPVWLSAHGDWYNSPEDTRFLPRDAMLDLSDPQTCYGVALLLDAWEEAHAPGGARTPWVDAVGTKYTPRMIARLTQIGMDHAIRRELGEGPPLGTLAALTRIGNAWRLDSREHDGIMIEWDALNGDALGMAGLTDSVPRGYRSVLALVGIDNPAEALAAIYQEVISD